MRSAVNTRRLMVSRVNQKTPPQRETLGEETHELDQKLSLLVVYCLRLLSVAAYRAADLINPPILACVAQLGPDRAIQVILLMLARAGLLRLSSTPWLTVPENTKLEDS